MPKNIRNPGSNPQYINPYYTLVNEYFIKAAHEAKVEVVPWTVNDEQTMKKMADLFFLNTCYTKIFSFNFVKQKQH
ncbi:glycerophosphodiester phosphodiesterase family protein [Arcticibacter sp. MXS-1]|uniref:glycerophosphodiester phosphodiesterase family protein n=1 Tax=Arcticibacter sp. MXS-1 TaxID=3341726 RepID=UPI0035A8FF7B